MEIALASIRDNRRRVDFDEILRASECADDDAGGNREDAFQPAAYDAVDILAVARIGDVDGDFADVLEFAACLLKQHVDICHGLLGLSRYVADAYAFRCVELLPYLPAQE